MAYTNAHLHDLNQMLVHERTCNLEEHSDLSSEAVFVVEEDHAYFVLSDQGKFYAIIGEFRGETVDAQFEPHSFAVNRIEEFQYRDSAIASVLNCQTNDAGREDSTCKMAAERAKFFTPWQ